MKIIETPILVENRKFKRRSWNEIGKHCRKISSECWNFSRSRSKYGGRFENHRNSNFGRKRKFKENVSERRKILSEYWTFFSRFRSFTVDVLKIIEIQILDENRKLQRKSWNRKMCRKILSECWTRVRKSRTRMKEKRSDPPSSTSNTNHPSGFDRYLLSPNHFEGNIPGTFHKYFDTFLQPILWCFGICLWRYRYTEWNFFFYFFSLWVTKIEFWILLIA